MIHPATTRAIAAATLGMLTGCMAATAPAPAPPVRIARTAMTGTSESDSPYIARDLALTLVPSGGEPAAGGPAAWEVWKGVIRGLKEDPESAATLKRVLGDWPAKLEVLDLDAATDAALRAEPAPGDAFAVRIASQGTEKRGTSDRDGLVGLVQLGVTVRIEGTPPHQNSGRTVVVQGRTVLAGNVPDPDEIVVLLAEDYVLRHHPDWRIYGPDGDPKNDPLADPKARRGNLDTRIADFAARIRSFYGAPKAADPGPQ